MGVSFRSTRQEFMKRGGRLAYASAALIALLAVALTMWALFKPVDPAPLQTRLAETTDTAVKPKLDGGAPVEVPDVVGATLAEAKVVVDAAGLALAFEGSSADESVTVTEQEPQAGTIADASTTMTLTLSVEPTSVPAAKAAEVREWVVVVDPGHQARSDMRPEPVGPGSKKTKPRVTGGTTGVSTGVPEYEVALQIATNLCSVLESKGVKVIMTRTTNDVNISNAERAMIANMAKADVFIRVHADGSPDQNRSGITVLYPKRSKSSRALVRMSRHAADEVRAAVVAETGAVDLGLVARDDLAGFNHSKIPSLLVETGFMSNPVEDRLLVSPHYQDKLARGMAEGLMRYLSGTEE